MFFQAIITLTKVGQALIQKNQLIMSYLQQKKNLNTWVTVKANVKEDFLKLHGLDVKDLSGVAIMTDTDNSKIQAIAYYQNIYFSSE